MDYIDLLFDEKEVEDSDAIRGIMDNVKYHIFEMKESNYVIKNMGTYSGLTMLDGQKESVRKYKGVDGTENNQYCEPFATHLLYKHTVDDHNNLSTKYNPLKVRGWNIDG